MKNKKTAIDEVGHGPRFSREEPDGPDPDVLEQAVGMTITNVENIELGEIVSLDRDEEEDRIAYVILKSDELFGKGERFFAIPAAPSYIKVTDDGNIILMTSKDELQFAKGISARQRPKPNFNLNPSVFELYKYEEAQ